MSRRVNIHTRDICQGPYLHDGDFQETDEGQNLEGTGDRDIEGSFPARSKIRELGSRVVNIAREIDTGLVDEETNNTKHANASMLQLNVTKTLKLGLIGAVEETKRIPKSKGLLNTNLIFKGGKGRRSGGLLRGGKGGGGGKERGDNGELHLDKRANSRIVLWTIPPDFTHAVSRDQNRSSVR